jgi:surfactin synthase thioesterase subunit
MSPPTDRWLLREPSSTATTRLFCLPYAGAGASVYRRWPAWIGSLEVCPLQPPGRENRLREPSSTDFGGFAAAAAAAVRPYLDRPYAVFGHCMGSLLAHALAAELSRGQELAPGRLIVSSSRVPHWAPSRRYRLPTPGAVGVYHPSMSDVDLGREIAKVAARQGGELGDELLPLAVRVLRGDLAMCFDYAPAGPEPVGCPVSTVAWRSDVDVPAEEMTEWAACGPVTPHLLDGDKMTFVEAPDALLRVIQDDWSATAADRVAAEVAR